MHHVTAYWYVIGTVIVTLIGTLHIIYIICVVHDLCIREVH